jgi:hypothetical protein
VLPFSLISTISNFLLPFYFSKTPDILKTQGVVFDHFDNFRDEIIISTNCFLSIGTQTIDCKIRTFIFYLSIFLKYTEWIVTISLQQIISICSIISVCSTYVFFFSFRKEGKFAKYTGSTLSKLMIPKTI